MPVSVLRSYNNNHIAEHTHYITQVSMLLVELWRRHIA